MSLTDETLAPCPFCGKTPSLDRMDEKEWDVECYCKAGIIACGPTADSEQAAIEAWNTRHSTSPTDNDVERVADAIANADLDGPDPEEYWSHLARAALQAIRGTDEGLDKARLDFLQSESNDLRCFSIPTGGDDADIGWRVVGHYMGEPRERIIGEVFHDSVRGAIDAARAALREHGAYSDKFANHQGIDEGLRSALDLARNRLRAAAINEAPNGGDRYYEYSQWADEADEALSNHQGNAR